MRETLMRKMYTLIAGSAVEDLQDEYLLDEAIKEYEAGIDLDPNYRLILDHIIPAYLAKNDLVKAHEYAQRQVASYPGEANPWDALGRIYIFMGQLDLAIQSFAKSLSIKPDFVSSMVDMSYAYGLKENYPEAIRWADNALTIATNKDRAYTLKALYEYWSGSFQKALEDAERLWPVWGLLLKSYISCYHKKFDLSLDAMAQHYDILIKMLPRWALAFRWGKTIENIYIYANTVGKEDQMASIEIRAGKIEAARKRLITVNRLLTESKDPVQKKVIENYQMSLQAKVLIAEGSYGEAISTLERLRTGLEGLGYYWSFSSTEIYEGNMENLGVWGPLEIDLLADAYELNGDLDKAIGVLEQRARFNWAAKDWRLIPPKFYYELGRLYEKKGVKQKARVNYEKFLDLWKNADPGLPEVEDARKRLAGL